CRSAEPCWSVRDAAGRHPLCQARQLPILAAGPLACSLTRCLLWNWDHVMHRFGRPCEELLDVACSLANAMLVLYQGDAHEAFPILAEPQARRHGDVCLVDEELCKLN